MTKNFLFIPIFCCMILCSGSIFSSSTDHVTGSRAPKTGIELLTSRVRGIECDIDSEENARQWNVLFATTGAAFTLASAVDMIKNMKASRTDALLTYGSVTVCNVYIERQRAKKLQELSKRLDETKALLAQELNK